VPADDTMTIDERRKYLRRMQRRYRKATRQERSALLDEMEEVTDLHRKTLISLLHSDLERHPRRTQRGRAYGADVDDALRVIAQSFDYITAERLTGNLRWMAECLEAHGELTLCPVGVHQQLHGGTYPGPGAPGHASLTAQRA